MYQSETTLLGNYVTSTWCSVLIGILFPNQWVSYEKPVLSCNDESAPDVIYSAS